MSLMCGPMALKWGRGHPVFINPQAGLAVGALSLPRTPPNKSQWLNGSCPAAADRAFPNAGAQWGQTCLHPWALILFLSLHLPPSVPHSQPRSGRMTAHHAVRWYNGANNVAECPHFFCQTVVVCVLDKMAADWRVLREGAVWMKGLCTDLIKSQCSNYCSSVCDKWTELDTTGRENTHIYRQVCTHTYTPAQTKAGHVVLLRARGGYSQFLLNRPVHSELNLVSQCGVRHK